MNQNTVAGGSSLMASGAGSGGNLVDASLNANTGVRATSILNRVTGILTAGGADAPTDVARPFDTITEAASDLLSTGSTVASDLVPGGAVQGAGIFSLLTGRNLMIAGGLLVIGFLIWKALSKKE